MPRRTCVRQRRRRHRRRRRKGTRSWQRRNQIRHVGVLEDEMDDEGSKSVTWHVGCGGSGNLVIDVVLAKDHQDASSGRCGSFCPHSIVSRCADLRTGEQGVGGERHDLSAGPAAPPAPQAPPSPRQKDLRGPSSLRWQRNGWGAPERTLREESARQGTPPACQNQC